MTLASGPQAAGSPAGSSRTPVKASSAWKRYVVNPGKFAYPKHVYVAGAGGRILNPRGLKARGGGATSIVANGQGGLALILDLGANVGGYVEVGVRSSTGTPILLGYSELLDYLTPGGDNCGCGAQGLSLGLSDDPEGRYDSFRTTRPMQFRSPGIRGAERYIALQLQGPGAVTIDYVRVRTEHLHPGPDGYGGYFLSSSSLLNRIWYASAYTFALDSFRDPHFGFSGTVVADGAKRDRLIWAGDLSVEDLVGAYSLRSAPNVLRRSLAAFSCLQFSDGQLSPTTQIAVQCPRTPPAPVSDASAFPRTALPIPGFGALRLPTYTADWIIAVRDYYLLTGDRAFARAMMPVVRRGLGYFLGHLDGGLYRTPSSGLTINWHPFDTAAGFDTNTNATVYRALQAGAMLESGVGSRGAANFYLQQAAALKAAILSRLWDPQAGAFIGNTDDPQRDHTQDAQAESILGGITSPSQAQQALRFIDGQLLKQFGVANGQFNDDPYMTNYISPYISSIELLARLSAGDVNGALNLMQRTWGRMLAKGPGTVWERMGFDGMPGGDLPGQPHLNPFDAGGSGAVSLAHGWAGGPVPALSGYVLGLRPTAPGYRHWIVAPEPGYLHFAQGQAPTPHGALSSRWRRGKGSFKLTVAAPRGTSGVVEVPLIGHAHTVAMDGKVVWSSGHHRGHTKRAGDVVLIKAVRGQHTFAVG